jgi:hypothetical protein
MRPAWESNGNQMGINAYNCFPQEATRRTERPTLNYETVLDSTRWTGARGFLNRVSGPLRSIPRRYNGRCTPRG